MCLKRFKESRSRWIYPAFPEHGNVFYGAWGIASTSRKTIRSTKAEWMVFRICITGALLATTISVSSLPKCLALGFVLLSKLTLIYGLICDFCSSGQSFAHWETFQLPKSGFLQIPPHDGHPCLWLALPATGRTRDFHPRERALTGRTAKNAHFRPGGFERFLLVGKHPKPFASQVPCELRTPRALMFCL